MIRDHSDTKVKSLFQGCWSSLAIAAKILAPLEILGYNSVQFLGGERCDYCHLVGHPKRKEGLRCNIGDFAKLLVPLETRDALSLGLDISS